MEPPTISIVVPSYRRPEYLTRCLAALRNQEFGDFEVLCVCRETDIPTKECISAATRDDARVKEVNVTEEGVAAAMMSGLSAATGEFVTFTDDDAEAPPHWLRTIVTHLRNHPECGGVGGQDRLQVDDPLLREPKAVSKVGMYSMFGRFAATHHHPITREFVRSQILKGVNMTFRRQLVKDVKIGHGLKGMKGALMGHEQGLCAAVLRADKEIHFVRDAWLLHHISPRYDGCDRLDMTTPFAINTTYNYSYALFRFQKLHTAIAAFLWSLTVGSWLIPGIPRLLIHPSKWRVTLMHIRPALAGAIDGLRARRGDTDQS